MTLYCKTFNSVVALCVAQTIFSEAHADDCEQAASEYFAARKAYNLYCTSRDYPPELCLDAGDAFIAALDKHPDCGNPQIAIEERAKVSSILSHLRAYVAGSAGRRQRIWGSAGTSEGSANGGLVPHGSSVGIQYPSGTVCTTPGTC